MFDFDFKAIARLEVTRRVAGIADAGGGPGENDGTGGEGGIATEEGDQFGNGKDHIGGITILDAIAVEEAADAQGVGIGKFVEGEECGAEGAKGIKALAPAELTAAPFFLPIAGTDIVGGGVAKDGGGGLAGGNVATGLAEDDGQFGFVINLVAMEGAREEDGFIGILEAARHLDKKDGTLRENTLHFEGVGAVVLGDSDDERGIQRSEASTEGEALVGGTQWGEQVSFEEAGFVGMDFLGEDGFALVIEGADDAHNFRRVCLKVG